LLPCILFEKYTYIFALGMAMQPMEPTLCHSLSFATANESVPKIIIGLNDTINLVFLNCNQHFANFKP